jgi:glyoxylase-like metal-dependent hydrolase (beta-lactamase superfamily II)
LVEKPMTASKVSIFAAGFCTCPEHIAIQGGRWRNIRFPAMFALLEHPRFGAMLFDTGYSYRFFNETRHFPNRLYQMITPVTLHEEQLAVNQLAARGLKPSDIRTIIISHFHADHVAALADFPRARYVYLSSAFDSVRKLRGLNALRRGHLSGLIPGDFEERAAPIDISVARPLPPEFAPFHMGFDLLGDQSLMAVVLPGHAAGQIGLFARDHGGAAYFFVADAAWLGESIRENRPPHRLANFLFPDPIAYRATLTNLYQFQASCADVHLIPSHCEKTLSRYVTLENA